MVKYTVLRDHEKIETKINELFENARQKLDKLDQHNKRMEEQFSKIIPEHMKNTRQNRMRQKFLI